MKKYNPEVAHEGSSAWSFSDALPCMEEDGNGEYVKAEVAERLYIALEQMVSITTIAQREYGEKFAWAELECAFEAIKYAEEN